MSLSTKTAPHLPWSLAASSPADMAAKVSSAASIEALGVTPEAPNGEPVKARAKGGGGGGVPAVTGAGGGGDEAMAEAKAPSTRRGSGALQNAEAEAAAAEAAVDAVGDADGVLG
jgi:hypothetical protein